MQILKNKTTLRLATALTVLLVATTASYLYFSSYQPKILKRVEEVKGLKATSTLELLYPESAQVISLTQTKIGTQTSYKTQKTQEYIQVFYKNLFLDMGWEEKLIKKSDTSLVYKFGKGERTASVTAQKEDSDTLVSVEVSAQ